MTNPIKASLQGNQVPSQDKIDRAVAIGRAVIESRDNRDALIKSLDLNEQFVRPDGNWIIDRPDVNDGPAASKMLETLKWEDIKYLRHRSQCFTGYSLSWMRPSGGLQSTAPIPDGFDERILVNPNMHEISRWRRLIVGVADNYIFKPKHMLGEVGWIVDGVIINEDTLAYQERMSMLYNEKIIKDGDKVLEIGGGFGALASGIMAANPNCEYWICDIPESLLYAGLYLAMTQDAPVSVRTHEDMAPRPGINLIPNYLFEFIRDVRPRFDVVINTLSLAEMSQYQIIAYAKEISELIGTTGVFFEQNQDNTHMHEYGTDCKSRISASFKNRRRIINEFPIYHGQAEIWDNRERA